MRERPHLLERLRCDRGQVELGAGGATPGIRARQQQQVGRGIDVQAGGGAGRQAAHGHAGLERSRDQSRAGVVPLQRGDADPLRL